VTADLEDPLPDGPWDAVVSALAIHHLSDAAKRQLFRRVAGALRPGGVFVNAEQVRGTTPLFDEHCRSWHARRAAELGTTRDEWNAALERMQGDRRADVESPLLWLREAGFDDADCRRPGL
jgi:tRNA (cmo5U34)-methyltransferase